LDGSAKLRAALSQPTPRVANIGAAYPYRLKLGAGGANRDGLRVRIVGVVRQVCVVGCGFRRLRFDRIGHAGVAAPS
jgi:hypothetical protein